MGELHVPSGASCGTLVSKQCPQWVDIVEEVGSERGDHGRRFVGERFRLSRCPDLRSVRQELGELPEVLGCGGEVELVSGAVGSA